MRHCAIIGAGAAGLAAAQHLLAAGVRVTVFDKGRCSGGRIASRSTAVGSFDHGAQYMRLRDPYWQQHAQEALRANAIQPWPSLAGADGNTAWIGTPGMNALGQYWATGLDLHCGQTLVQIEGTVGARLLRFSDQQLRGPYTELIITAPAPQALAWLDWTDMSDALHSVTYAPSLALMWAPSARHLPETPVFQPEAVSGFSFIAREDLKPGRQGQPRYLVHASADWSARHLDEPAHIQQQALLEQAARWLEIRPDALHLDLHRWRYALVTLAVGQPFLRHGSDLFYASDGCLGGRIEAALRSGRAAATELLR